MSRTRVLAALVALWAAPVARADLTPVPPPPGLLPADQAGLASLRQKHSSIVRRADRQCAHQYGWSGGIDYRACVVGSVDNAILLSQDPHLQAYHRSLPFPIRYQWRNAGSEPWAIR